MGGSSLPPRHGRIIFSVQVVDIFPKLCYIMVMVYSNEAAMFKSKVSKLAGLKGLVFCSSTPGRQDSALPDQRKSL
jgi:hypothetical protein